MTAHQHLALSKKHLSRVQAAWDAPTDWADLALYGFYCLENAVSAAATHAKIAFSKSHPSKAVAASTLTTSHGLPDVSSLLVTLNDARKSVAYGDVSLPTLDPEDLANDIEAYVTAVETFLGR